MRWTMSVFTSGIEVIKRITRCQISDSPVFFLCLRFPNQYCRLLPASLDFASSTGVKNGHLGVKVEVLDVEQ